MKTQATVATHKIILFVVFISAALISSLFVYHMNHKPINSALSPDDGLLFPAPRDIKPFELVAANGSPFTQQNFLNHWTLLFFGFTHCSTVCPATLDMIGKAYQDIHTAVPNLQVVLISLDPERDNPTALATYTHIYHPDFIGVSGKLAELRKLQSQLGIYAARDDNNNNSNYQLQHTSSILLINPQGKWAGLYKFGMTPIQFTQAVKTSINALTS